MITQNKDTMKEKMNVVSGDPKKKTLMQMRLSNSFNGIAFLFDVYDDNTYDILNLQGRKIVKKGQFSNATMKMIKRIITNKNNIPIKYKKPSNCSECVTYELFIDDEYYDLGYGFADLPDSLKNEDIVKIATYAFYVAFVNT